MSHASQSETLGFLDETVPEMLVTRMTGDIQCVYCIYYNNFNLPVIVDGSTCMSGTIIIQFTLFCTC